LVLLTKTDVAAPHETARVRGRIAQANPHAMVLDAPWGAVDPRLFFDAAQRTVPEGGQLPLWERGTTGGHAHHVHHRSASLD
ncbi:hypothetical protein LAN29_24790, partial [Mycobacterium tuberculosis]|nr:hypothetical protein [Mycobacterium tuberculosis]